MDYASNSGYRAQNQLFLFCQEHINMFMYPVNPFFMEHAVHNYLL